MSIRVRASGLPGAAIGLARLRSIVLAIVTCLVAACDAGSPMPPGREADRLPAAQPGNGVKAALVRTGHQDSREALTVAGGSFLAPLQMNYVAVLVRHARGELLFDSGLGRHIDEQFAAAMPFWVRPFLGYRDPRPAADQLGVPEAARIAAIVLSHGHWDHAGGLADFPQAMVYAPEAELRFVKIARPPAVLPAHFAGAGSRLQALVFDERRHGGFARSRDWFGDGSVVFVPLEGHTPGSIGMFLTVDSGRRYFFIGDIAWNARAIETGAPKPWFVRPLADHDAQGTLAALQRVRETAASNPGLVVVPAHDARVHDPIGYFPRRWLP